MVLLLFPLPYHSVSHYCLGIQQDVEDDITSWKNVDSPAEPDDELVGEGIDRVNDHRETPGTPAGEQPHL